jgi:3-polyprenyl-4-hydroxybenzoate decarboxylase
MKIGVVVNEDNNVFWSAGVLRVLSEQKDVELSLLTSEKAIRAFAEETGSAQGGEGPKESGESLVSLSKSVFYLDRQDALPEDLDALVIIPASSATIVEIVSETTPLALITLAMLKREKKVILLLSEKDFSGEHLERLVKLADLGAFIFPKLPDTLRKGMIMDEIFEVVTGSVIEMLGLSCELPSFEKDGYIH